MKGMVAAHQLAEIPLKLLASFIYVNVAGCDRIGQPTLVFPDGMPEGGAECIPAGSKFQLALHLTSAITWVVTLLGGYLGNKFQKIIGPFSLATTGATMTVKSLTELFLMILMETATQQEVAQAHTVLLGAETILLYALTGIGFAVQMLCYNHAQALLKDEKPPKITGIRRFVLRGPVLYLLKQMIRCEIYTSDIVAGNLYLPFCNNPRKIIKGRLRVAMTPKLEAIGLTWKDVRPIIDSVDTIAELKEVGLDIGADPGLFIFERMQDPVYQNIARKMFLYQVKEAVSPKLEKIGLTWDDIEPILNELDDAEAIEHTGRKMLDDPAVFLLNQAADPRWQNVAKKVAIFQWRQRVEPKLAEKGMSWDDDILPALEKFDTVDEINKYFEKTFPSEKQDLNEKT